MHVVYAQEVPPNKWSSSIFLCGPTPRDSSTSSWRPDALAYLEQQGYDGVVFVPEPRDGIWATGQDAYTNQIAWERTHLDKADVILTWVPRELPHMLGLTTNIEIGLYAASQKLVFGAPDEAVGVRYIESLLGHRYASLYETIDAVLARIQVMGPSERVGGECCIPLFIWSLPSFQEWYEALVQAGNRLDYAELLWHFRVPQSDFIFAWALKAHVWITSEQRLKTIEYVFSRTDISSVCLYYRPEGHPIIDTELVLIKEFRTSVRNRIGLVCELAGGSSVKPDLDPLQVASDEVHEETGLILSPHRFRFIQDRQVASTLSAHHAHVFAAQLTELEMKLARLAAQSNTVHGVAADTERTYVEVTTFGELLRDNIVDWCTLGMITNSIM